MTLFHTHELSKCFPETTEPGFSIPVREFFLSSPYSPRAQRLFYRELCSFWGFVRAARCFQCASRLAFVEPLKPSLFVLWGSSLSSKGGPAELFCFNQQSENKKKGQQGARAHGKA